MNWLFRGLSAVVVAIISAVSLAARRKRKQEAEIRKKERTNAKK